MPFLTKGLKRPPREVAREPSVRFRFSPSRRGFEELQCQAAVVEDPPRLVRIGCRRKCDWGDPAFYRFTVWKPWSYFIALTSENFHTLENAIVFFSEERLADENDPSLLYAPVANICYKANGAYSSVGICMGNSYVRGNSCEGTAVRSNELFWTLDFTRDVILTGSAVPSWMSRRGWLSRFRSWAARTKSKKRLTWREAGKECNSIKRAVLWLNADTDF